MKVRLSFVSNSSSSSFVVIGKEPKILSYKVTKPVAKRIVDYVNRNGRQVDWDGKAPVYVTQEIRDEQVEFMGWIEYASYDILDSNSDLSKTVKENENGEEVRIRNEHLKPDSNKVIFKKKVKELSKELRVKYKLEII